jgi:HK97 family phage portal protein
MNWIFWKRDKQEEAKQRGYFDLVNAPDGNVTTWWESYVSGSSPTLAMKIATVYRCVDILSSTIASLTLELKVKRNGVFEVKDTGTLAYLLTCQANERQTSYELIQNAIIQMVMDGNAYILPKYRFGEIDSLVLLSPHTTTYDKETNLYAVNDFTNAVFDVFDADEIIHLRNISLDGGYTGVSTITYAAKCLNISASADERTSDSFKPGNTMKGFISGDGDAGVRGFGELQDNQLKAITDRVEAEINSGKNIFHIPGQSKFNQISISPTDLQLLDTRKFGVLEICRFFGVHPDKVFAGQSQNYKASEMSNVSFLSDTLMPKLRKIETSFTAKLVGKVLFSKMKIEFDIEPIYQTDLATMGNYIEKTVQNGVYTPNYWRAKKNQQPKAGGDQLFISCNVAPVDSIKIRGEEKNLPPKTDDNTNK